MEVATPTKRKEMQKLAENIFNSNKTACRFNKSEIENLLVRFYLVLCGKTCTLDRTKFRDWLHNYFDFTDDIMMDRVFRAFDADNDSLIGPTEFVLGLSVFMRGSFKDRIDYCFNVYDLNNDGYISREEMFHMLKNSLIKVAVIQELWLEENELQQPQEEDPDEGVKELVDVCLKKMDCDHDNRVSNMDFVEAIQHEPLLLEAFGQCLPSEKAIGTFEEMLGGNGITSVTKPPGSLLPRATEQTSA